MFGSLSFYVSSSHEDFSVAKKHAIEARRLYNTLNKIKQEQTAKYYKPEAQTPVTNSLSITNSNDLETARKLITAAQNIDLPVKVSQNVRDKVKNTWSSFYASRRQKRVTGIPSFKQTYTEVPYNNQAIRNNKNMQDRVVPTGWKQGFKLPSHVSRDQVQSALLIHKPDGFVLKVLYKKKDTEIISNDVAVFAGIDFGVNKLVTVVTTDKARPKSIDGRFLKSLNRYFNKENARLSVLISESLGVKKEVLVKRRHRLWYRREKQMDQFLQSASNELVKYFVSSGVQVVVVGWSDGFKLSSNLGRRNNQSFVQLPMARFRDLLLRKCADVGIEVKVQEESYTSKASCVDGDVIPVFDAGFEGKHVFSGYRVSRGMYKSKVSGIKIHADVNAAWNILRKCMPSIGWSSGDVVTPENLVITY